MSFEFECPECGAFTIFKDLASLPKDSKRCLQCDTPFTVEHDLVRFDRTDQDKLGTLIEGDAAATQRLKVIAESMKDLIGRIERVEELLLDEHAEDLVN